jgi:hypothetical protein
MSRLVVRDGARPHAEERVGESISMGARLLTMRRINSQAEHIEHRGVPLLFEFRRILEP